MEAKVLIAIDIRKARDEIARIKADLRAAGEAVPDAPGDLPAGATGARPTIPEILPYMANRSAQEETLCHVVQQYASSSCYRLLFFVHGDEHQCHDMYRRRLQKVSLRKYLVLDKKTPIKDYILKWPRHLHNLAQMPEKLCHSLADSMAGQLGCGHHAASLEQINQALADTRCPVMIHTHLSTDDLKHHGTDLLTACVRFWYDWPAPLPGQRVLLFVFFKYQSPQKQGVFQRINPKQRCVRQKLNTAVEQALTAEAPPWADVAHPFCTVLPKLEDIPQGDVEDWARFDVERWAQHYAPGYRKSYVFNAIKELFEREPTNRMSMNQLHHHLFEILEQVAERKGTL